MTISLISCLVIYDSPEVKTWWQHAYWWITQSYMTVQTSEVANWSHWKIILSYMTFQTTEFWWQHSISELLCYIYDSPDFRICKWMTISLIDNLLSYMAFQITLVTTRWHHSYWGITLSYMTVQASSVVWWWETSSRLMMASSRRNKKNWKQMSMG